MGLVAVGQPCASEAPAHAAPESLNDRLRAASPAAHAGEAQAPILLVLGRDDSAVPIRQRRALESALRRPAGASSSSSPMQAVVLALSN